jgi:hypothetical protein
LCTTCRALRDQPRDKTAHAAAAHDFFDVAEKTFPAFDRPLRRPQIGFVEDEMQRLLVGFVQRFAESRHETPARRIAAELGEIDDGDKGFASDHMPKRGAHIGGHRHVGMAPAKDDNGITGCGSVGAGAQAPPDAKGVDDGNMRTGIEQALDESLCRIGLARPGGAYNRDAVVEGVGGKGERKNPVATGRSGTRPALADGGHVRGSRSRGQRLPTAATKGSLFMMHSLLDSEKWP